ncbi:hypothetical protein LCGC14_2811540 [marine sediment metagenome]|uniref:Uncharacterized protein n=1 Tax=marine sediment metagenome TaxID=412755 RepID=A0A0F8YJP1_9ZZZZ
MTSKTSKQLLAEIHTVLLGIPGSDDKGLVGVVGELATQVQGMSRAVQVNTTWRKALAWMVGVVVIGLATLVGIVVT